MSQDFYLLRLLNVLFVCFKTQPLTLLTFSFHTSADRAAGRLVPTAGRGLPKTELLSFLEGKLSETRADEGELRFMCSQERTEPKESTGLFPVPSDRDTDQPCYPRLASPGRFSSSFLPTISLLQFPQTFCRAGSMTRSPHIASVKRSGGVTAPLPPFKDTRSLPRSARRPVSLMVYLKGQITTVQSS